MRCVSRTVSGPEVEVGTGGVDLTNLRAGEEGRREPLGERRRSEPGRPDKAMDRERGVPLGAAVQVQLRLDDRGLGR